MEEASAVEVFPREKSDTCVNLKVIGKIQVGDKLTTWNNRLNFEEDGWLWPIQSIKRTALRENRGRTVDVIETVLADSVQTVGNYLDRHWQILGGASANLQNTSTNHKKIEKSVNIVITDLQAAVDGLCNMKETYSEDRVISTRLEVLADTTDRDIRGIQTRVFTLARQQ
jgi:hypothetical protein